MEKIIEELFKTADYATKEGNYKKAIEIYDKVIEICMEGTPPVHLAHWGIGEIHLNNHRYKKAEYHLGKALELEPNEPIYHYLLGCTFRYMDKIDSAISHLQRAVQLDDTKDIYWCELGWVVGFNQDLEKGIYYLKKALEINPLNSKALTDLAMLYANDHKFSEALVCIEEALKHNPDDIQDAEIKEGLQFFKSEFERLSYLSDPLQTEVQSYMRRNTDRDTINTTIKPAKRTHNKSEQSSQQTVYQLKVVLLDTQPPVWRKFVVPSRITLHRLHLILQDVMGWTNSHLYRFQIGTKEYAEPDPDNEIYELDFKNSKRTKLGQVVFKKGDIFHYVYDFGDNWTHMLVPSCINI